MDDLMYLSLIIAVQAIGEFPALPDLANTSPAIWDLEHGNPTESGTRRGSIVPYAQSGYLGGPLLLLFNGNGPLADRDGQVLIGRGTATLMSGLGLMHAGYVSDDNFWELQMAGSALVQLGRLEVNYWAFWNYSIIGDIPNDGIVPAYSMIMPRSTNVYYPGGHVMHTQETSSLAPYLYAKIGELFNR